MNAKEALSRIHNHFTMGGDKAYGTDMIGSFGADLETLGQAYLAEHPADEDEPVTAEWLRSIGFERMHESSFDWHHPLIAFVRVRACEVYPKLFHGCSAAGWHLVALSATRGQVRLLCRALGVELKEGK